MMKDQEEFYYKLIHPFSKPAKSVFQVFEKNAAKNCHATEFAVK